MRVIATTIAVGNRVIVFPSEINPVIAGELIQVIETSDIPAGVVNILFADHNDVAKHTAMHMDIDAVWCEETAAISSMIEEHSATNFKRTWAQMNDVDRDPRILDHAIEKKTVWIPRGEG